MPYGQIAGEAQTRKHEPPNLTGLGRLAGGSVAAGFHRSPDPQERKREEQAMESCGAGLKLAQPYKDGSEGDANGTHEKGYQTHAGRAIGSDGSRAFPVRAHRSRFQSYSMY